MKIEGRKKFRNCIPMIIFESIGWMKRVNLCNQGNLIYELRKEEHNKQNSTISLLRQVQKQRKPDIIYIQKSVY